MRVLNVITDRDRRGAQVFGLDLARGLEELGDSVTTVALAPGEHGDLLAVGVLGPARRSPQTLLRLRRAARDVDVVIAHGSTTLFACSVALIGAGVPFVYRQISDPLFWASALPRRVRVGAMLRRAAGIVTLSPITAEVVRSHYRLPVEAMIVVPNAVPAERFRPPTPNERSMARARWGADDGAVVVGYVGALVEEKGVAGLIDAVRSMADVRLVIAGDGPEMPRLRDIARGCADRVMFTGALDDARTVYWAADVVALPSRSGDSMPATLIEAGLCGVPCIATDVGAITDIVIDGRTGIVVPAGAEYELLKAIERLASDADVRASMGRAASEHCGGFTIEATAPAWHDYLVAVCRATR